MQESQQQQQQSVSCVTSQLPSQKGQQVSLHMCQEPHDLLPMKKKPRRSIKNDHVMQQQVIQQLHHSQLQALTPQQRLLQRQQILQSMSEMQQQQQQRARLPARGINHSFNGGICARRMMQYIYHHCQRPQDNNIFYWRKFVDEYFAPRAKKRWCLSSSSDMNGHGSLSIFPQGAMLDTWHCDICGSKSGRGFEMTADILPRLCEIEVDSGVVDELLSVDKPHEFRFPSGLMMLQYGKAIQESVYKQVRVVREGQLRIIFTPDLKILSWEFCVRHQNEFFPHSLVSSQVGQLVQVAEKYQTTVNESGSAGVSRKDLLTNWNMFLTAGGQLARNLDLQFLELGFSRRYLRCLQISEVVNSMKDLIDFSQEHNIGPIESLKEYSQQATAAKLQVQKVQELERLLNSQGLSTDQTNFNKIMAMRPGLSSDLNNNLGSRAVINRAQAALALNNYQNLPRQSSMNASLNSRQTDKPCSFNGANSSHCLPFPSPVSPVLGSLPSETVSGLSSSNPQPSLLPQQNQQQSSLTNSHLQKHVVLQILREMSTDGGILQQPPCWQNANGNAADYVLSTANGAGSLPSRTAVDVAEVGNNTANAPNNIAGTIPCSTNNFRTLANNSTAPSGNGLRPDILQDPLFAELVQGMPSEFAENGILDCELHDMDYCWNS